MRTPERTAIRSFHAGGAGYMVTGLQTLCATYTTTETGGTGKHANGSDLWPVCWSNDNLQYTAWGDGNGFSGSRVSYGVAQLDGEFSDFEATDLLYGPSGSGGGKIASMLSIGGIIYLWFNEQNASNYSLRKSADKFASALSAPLFLVNAENRMFILHGKDEAASPDGYVYALQGDSGTTENSYLVRVPPQQIETAAQWQWFTGTPGMPQWGLKIDRTPVFVDLNSLASANHRVAVYVPAIERYILTTRQGQNIGEWQLYEAPKPWGPWALVRSYADNEWCGFTGDATENLPKYIAPRWIGNEQAGEVEIVILFSAAGLGGDYDKFNAVQAKLTVEK